MASAQKRRKPSVDPPGAIDSGVLYTLEEAARRLRWARRACARAQREGLQTIGFGRRKYVLGGEILRFFKQLQEAGDDGR